MKKLLVFLFTIIIGLVLICALRPNKCYAVAKEGQTIINHKENSFVLDLSSNCHSKMRNNINNFNTSDQLVIIDKIVSMGFTREQALYYVFPNLQQSINNVCNKLLITAQEPRVFADKNNCKIIFENAKNGVKVDKNQLINDFYESLRTGNAIDIKLQEIASKNTLEGIKNKFVKVAEFVTDFSKSSEARKNNIVVASAAINGKFIKSGAEFSFNDTTGARTIDKGYQIAKIIENGNYTEGVGGGVCQVSTTLYNACLLSGLSVSEVHNHSLLSGYVDPAFDAMVSMGTSDLKIKNNTKYDFLITTSSNQNLCKVCIYGTRPQYTIKARYDKYEDLPAGEDIVETDACKYGNKYDAGSHRISYGTDGCKVKGYLDYYSGEVLVRSELIRDCTYSPKRGVVLIV